MYVRVWYEGGAVSDRPCTIVWDGRPCAEWPADTSIRVAVAAELRADDGRPLVREERRVVVPAGCAHAVVVDLDSDAPWVESRTST